MSASVASKNLYELLGNDPPEDEEPSKAPREIIKAVNTTKKRDEKIAPSAASVTGGYAPVRGDRGANRGRYTGNERAFRDRDAGRDNNLTKSTEDSSPRRGGYGRGRGGGGGGGGGRGGGRREFDRHNATGKDEHEKQADHGWGAPKGDAEWNDELAGAELAQKDASGVDQADPNATPAEGEAAEIEAEEDKTKTLDEYLAERAARQADLGPPQEIRRPNEGTRTDKKWANAKPIEKEEEEYFTGESKDKSRNRERKQKNILDIEPRYEPVRDGRGRGDRGRGVRGGGRGGERGRGDRAPRGDPRGDPRGYGSGPRNGGQSKSGNTTVNLEDKQAFPSLGA